MKNIVLLVIGLSLITAGVGGLTVSQPSPMPESVVQIPVEKVNSSQILVEADDGDYYVVNPELANNSGEDTDR